MKSPAPLGLEDEMFAGIPDRVKARVAVLESKEEENKNLPHAATAQAIPPMVQPLHAWMNRPDAQRALHPRLQRHHDGAVGGPTLCGAAARRR